MSTAGGLGGILVPTMLSKAGGASSPGSAPPMAHRLFLSRGRDSRSQGALGGPFTLTVYQVLPLKSHQYLLTEKVNSFPSHTPSLLSTRSSLKVKCEWAIVVGLFKNANIWI